MSGSLRKSSWPRQKRSGPARPVEPKEPGLEAPVSGVAAHPPPTPHPARPRVQQSSPEHQFQRSGGTAGPVPTHHAHDGGAPSKPAPPLDFFKFLDLEKPQPLPDAPPSHLCPSRGLQRVKGRPSGLASDTPNRPGATQPTLPVLFLPPRCVGQAPRSHPAQQSGPPSHKPAPPPGWSHAPTLSCNPRTFSGTKLRAPSPGCLWEEPGAGPQD